MSAPFLPVRDATYGSASAARYFGSAGGMRSNTGSARRDLPERARRGMGMRLLWRYKALSCGMGGIRAGGLRPMHTHFAALQPTIRLLRPLPRTVQARTEHWLAG